MEFVHKSIMLEEVIESLAIKPNGIYVDGTLGGAGHSSEIVKRLGEDGRLIGIDQDGEAIEAATKRLKPYKDKVTIVRSNYAQMKEVLRDLGIPKVDGILLDLGVSSYQLDNAERGFTYREDVPLDMRMDQRQTKTAKDIVNDYSEMELYHIIRNYGEDKFAKNIAKHIVQARQKAPIETTGQLIEVIKAAIPKKVRATGGHPAKKTFQAIRIELNRELDVLRDSLDGMIDILDDGGRLCIITFHSLEDRIVKTIFRKNENPCTCPSDFPVCVCGKKSKGKVITRKPILPGETEMEENPRSKSAKLRIFERVLKLERHEMARTTRSETARRSRTSARTNRGMYVDGNTVRRLAEVPERKRQPGRQNPGRQQTDRNRKVQASPAQVPRQKHQLSKEAQKNRQKATAMNWGFVAFLAVVCVAILFCSVKYLRYKSEITAKMSTVASLEEELADLKEDNDAYYSQVTSNVDLNKIKQTALGRLGMKYPSDDQTVTYSTSGNSYVRQYQDIPDSK